MRPSHPGGWRICGLLSQGCRSCRLTSRRLQPVHDLAHAGASVRIVCDAVLDVTPISRRVSQPDETKSERAYKIDKLQLLHKARLGPKQFGMSAAGWQSLRQAMHMRAFEPFLSTSDRERPW